MRTVFLRVPLALPVPASGNGLSQRYGARQLHSKFRGLAVDPSARGRETPRRAQPRPAANASARIVVATQAVGLTPVAPSAAHAG